jgi:hypothetical protein
MTAAIVDARQPEQIAEIAPAAGLVLSDEDDIEISRLLIEHETKISAG